MKTSTCSAVNHWLEILSTCRIGRPGGAADLLKTLARMPREGKSCRIDRFQLALPKRSLLDHITSLAYYADVLKSLGMGAPSTPRMAQCIVFHDLAEALTGDAPDFTNPELSRHVSPENKAIAEGRANAVIAKALPARSRLKFEETLAILHFEAAATPRYFKMLDKTDPIIAIWRYMAAFGQDLESQTFLCAMGDFFQNPAPRHCCMHDPVAEFIAFLQNPQNALTYLQTGIAGIRERMNGPMNVLFIELIEARQRMLFTTTPLRLRFKPPLVAPPSPRTLAIWHSPPSHPRPRLQRT